MRGLRHKPKWIARALAVLLAVGFVAALVLFVGAYNGGSGDGATGALPTGEPTDGATPRSSASPSGAHPTTLAVPGGPTLTITPGTGPGLVIAGVPTHRLTMRVTSSEMIPAVGYLVPTSNDHSTGVVKKPGRSWSLTTLVTGRPAYALVFVQSGASGAAMTCRISVDGVVKSVKSTNGPYGRQVCYA